MRKFFAFFAVVLLLASAATAFAKVDPRSVMQNATVAPRMGTLVDDVPAAAPGGFARADTLNFGYYTVIGGNYYAVLGETWTWDHGAPNVREGWYGVDETQNPGAYFQRITTTLWSGHNNVSAAPILAGTGSIWIGLFEDQADALCWEAGLGYGNKWCQRLKSPVLTYDGSGDVNLSFLYFNDTENNFDYSKVYVKPAGVDAVLLNTPGFTDKIGMATYPTPPTGATYNRTITESELGGAGSARNIQVYFEFTSDGGWSDEDGGYTTDFGPFGADNVAIQNNVVGGPYSYNFDADIQGWTAEACAGLGSFFSIVPVGDYVILDPCACELAGNVAAFHDEAREHPVGQLAGAFSPPARKSIQAPYPSYNKIFADWDMYAELPQANGVFYRPGWNYYPFVCPQTGATQWSGRTGQGGWFYVGNDPECFLTRNVGTDWGVAPDCEQVGFVFEIYSSCDAFNVPNCTGVTNFTPLIDNVQIRMTGVPNAPSVSYEVGCRFQDNFNPGNNLNILQATPADISYDLHRDPSANSGDYADLLGDSLVVKGPVPTESTKFLTRLWFRVKREGPGQIHNSNYRTWLNRVSDARNIVGANGQFTFGWMDSVQVGTQVAKNKFVSQFHETTIEGGLGLTEDDYSGDEQGESNEIIPDNVLTPGTKIEYFVTANYICTPSVNYLLPDTAGKFYNEFEILPSFRNVSGGTYRYPCVLYVDAYNGGAQYFVENALNVVLNGAAVNDPVPDPTTWDRYDYLDAASNWIAPMFRNSGGNSGGSVAEFLGYKLIMVNTGDNPRGTMRTRDWQGFSAWMTATDCFGGSQTRQGFWANGDDVAYIIADPTEVYGFPEFLTTRLGADLDCNAYNEANCPSNETQNDTDYCVRLPDVVGVAWDQALALDVYGNWCPAKYSFDAIRSSGSGAVNKKYQKISGGYTAPNPSAAQVVNDQSANVSNYRTVLDGYSIHKMIKRHSPVGDPTITGECAFDTVNTVEGSLAEAREIIKWTLGISDPLALGLCEDPCRVTTGVGPGADQISGGLVNRLYQNNPNPFNPRTTISFSLAHSGPAKLVIFDVNGREVRTLVNQKLGAGMHSFVWDGTDNTGHPVASGVFWSQLSAGDYSSNKKMVVLK